MWSTLGVALIVIFVCMLVVAGLWWSHHRKSTQTFKEGSKPLRSKESLPTVDVVIPVLNEAHVLEMSVNTLRIFLHENFPYPSRIVIADNGSTDGTGSIAQELTERYSDVRLVSLSQRGRGRALRKAWTESDADIVAYMDVDLSTELEGLEKMCRAIHEEGYELATGSRLMKGSRVTRCFKRGIISRLYNLFIKCVLFTGFSDAQCGFKAASRRAVNDLVPLIKDQAWFFDTELLVLGEKLGYRIKDVPVRWVEDPDSRVKIVSTAWEDIKGVFRLRWLLWSRKLQPAVSVPESIRMEPPEPAVQFEGAAELDRTTSDLASPS